MYRDNFLFICLALLVYEYVISIDESSFPRRTKKLATSAVKFRAVGFVI
jgi:hypothetical protein